MQHVKQLKPCKAANSSAQPTPSKAFEAIEFYLMYLLIQTIKDKRKIGVNEMKCMFSRILCDNGMCTPELERESESEIVCLRFWSLAF